MKSAGRITQSRLDLQSTDFLYGRAGYDVTSYFQCNLVDYMKAFDRAWHDGL